MNYVYNGHGPVSIEKFNITNHKNLTNAYLIGITGRGLVPSGYFIIIQHILVEIEQLQEIFMQ